MKGWIRFALSGGLSALIAGCSALAPAPTPTPTSTPTPQPTDTPVPTDTPAPTATPEASDEEAPGYEFASQFAGEWVGEWNNTTFGSTGPAEATVVIYTDGTFQLTVDLGGMVFGIGDPPPMTFDGTYTEEGGSFSRTNDPLFGNMSITIDASGAIAGTAENIGGSTGSMDVNGTITAEALELNYHITLPDGTPAEGVLTMMHQ